MKTINDMKNYIIRSVKYFLALGVLYLLLMWVMNIAGMTPLTVADDIDILLLTPRGWIMLAAMVALASAYPKIGYVVRRVEGDMTDHREQIVAALTASGYELVGEANGEMHFRASLPSRVLMLFEDEIVVSAYGQWLEISGLRRQAVRIAIRMEGYIRNHNRHRA